jgi:hypothetical protein
MSRTPTDWAVWLPKAFFLDWSNRTNWEHNFSDPTIWLPLGLFPSELREGIVNNYYIRISKTQGDVFGIGVSGTGHTMGKNISSGFMDSSQPQSPMTISNEYLKALSDSINKGLREKQVPEEKIRTINISLEEFTRKVRDVLNS